MSSLEQALRERWAASDTLNALLASTQVVVGQRGSPAELPWVSITRESGFRKAQSSLNRLDATTIRFELYFADYDDGRALATALAKETPVGLHRDAFDITGDGRAVSVILENEGSIQDERGNWLFIVDFVVTYRRP